MYLYMCVLIFKDTKLPLITILESLDNVLWKKLVQKKYISFEEKDKYQT